MGERINKFELFVGAAGAIGQDASIDSDVIDLSTIHLAGSNAVGTLLVKTIGGTITVSVKCAKRRNGTFTATSVAFHTAVAAGVHWSALVNLPNAPFIKLSFLETNVAPVTSMDATLFIR